MNRGFSEYESWSSEIVDLVSINRGTSEHESSESSVLNGFIVVKFCGKERKVDLNGFHIVRRREIAIMGGILDFRCVKSI